ncbi:hypothetical protein Dd586_3998 [Dickeya parazeae Ech586]|uniref:Uncharacterized protein n=1 Tax=Dickeya zeae (strain Ech586) TaxID=590409 RepID=D2BZF2_DICZ5|nr:hypothetical protein Dd586_3998 [Dickeya parazeae Ech586]
MMISNIIDMTEISFTQRIDRLVIALISMHYYFSDN